MKNDRLSRCLENIDDRFIDEAADYKKKSRRRGVYFLAASLAACIAIVLLAREEPAGVISLHPDSTPPVESSASTASVGIYIPAIELPEPQQDIAMDMIACVVYNGAVYTQSERIEDAERLLGDYLGRATGGIDEWSDSSEYEVEFAGTEVGEVYTVVGYDPDFRICCMQEDGSAMLLERLNGITLDTGADLFADRLHLPGGWDAVSYLTHYDWNYETWDSLRELDLPEETVAAFLDELCSANFEYVWTGTYPNIYDSTVQGHLYFSMADGTTVPLRLIEGGYVGYENLGWYFVKMPGETFDTVLAACT